MAINLKNKRVLVMGLGLIGGGVETVKWLVKQGAKVLVTDLKNKKELYPSLKKLKGLPIKYHLGGHSVSDFSISHKSRSRSRQWSPDLIIKNPGVPNNSPFLKIAQKNKIPIETDISLFFKLWPGQIIGITGTRGKSTTATLIANIFKKAGLKTLIGGNIGQSPLKYLSNTKILKYCNTLIVLELSSWQLESLAKDKISPKIAVITNIYPDHLNRYKNLAEYIEAKKIIFKYQKFSDFIILNYDNKITRNLGQETKSQLFWFSKKCLPKQKNGIFIKKNKIYFQNQNQKKEICSIKDIKLIKLKGQHYLEDVLAALTVACLYPFNTSLNHDQYIAVKYQKTSNRICQIRPKIVKSVLKNFSGLPFRLELVRVLKGVKYYNDTTATSPEATIGALKALNHKIKKIILICGGADKKLKFDKLAKIIKKTCKFVILLTGTATLKLKKELLAINYQRIKETNSMKIAVQLAQSLARKGDFVLLSPACASFGLFKNEFDRGKQFIKIVKNLKN